MHTARLVRFLYIVSTSVILFTPTLLQDLFAQPALLRFRRISVTEGLSSQFVTSIAQDKKGFLWFGTQDGINRFDGYSFVVHRSQMNDSTKLRGNYINRLLYTSDGMIWVGTNVGGIGVYNLGKETFTNYYHVPGDLSTVLSNNITALYQDRKGRMWVGAWKGGLEKIDTSHGRVRFLHYIHNPLDSTSLSSNGVSSLIEDRKGNLWIGTWNGLNRMEPDGRFTRYFHSDSGPQSLGGNKIWSLTLDSTGYIWIGTWDGGVSCYNPETDRFRVYRNIPSQPNSLSSDRIRCVYTDRRGVVWIGTYDTGLDRYDRAHDNFTNYRNTLSDPASLPADNVESIMEDAAGALWMGTGAGIATIDPYRHKFPLLQFSKNVPSFSFNQVRGLLVDGKGDLWYGTMAGLVHVPQDEKKIVRYRFTPDNPHSLGHDNVTVLWEQRDGTFWAGTNGGGLNRLDRKTGKFYRYVNDPKDSSSLSGNQVAAIVEVSDGSLWVGTFGNGLSRRDSRTGEFIRFQSIAEDSTTLGGSYVWALFEDSRKNLWIGALNAPLSSYDQKKRQFVRYNHLPGDSSTAGLENVLSITEDRNGKIWFGSIEGICCYDYATNQFRTYSEQHGLASRMTCGIAVDRHNCIWISTLRGVSKFDQTTETFRNYTASDGLQGIDFEQYACATDSRGRIYFGGDDGINIFDPDSIKENPAIPPVYITSMKVLEKPFSLVNSQKEGIVLNYDQNFISFEYAALSYSAPERNQYAYMLEGVDAGWVQAETRRYASYTDLAPGKYVFRVRGSNNDGAWNLEGAELAITITPPFWMTWWFRSIIIFGFLSAGPIVYFRSVNQLQKEKKRQEESSKQLINSQEEERKRIASELHDSIGQNLLFIKNSAVLGTNKNDLKRYADISETASSSIEEVRRIAFNLFPYQLDRMGLTKAIESVVRAIGESSAIQFGTDIQNIDGIFSKEQESSIFRIVQECLNNIIKHSGADRGTVVVRKNNDELVVTIGDNGLGFEVEGMKNESKGFGLKNINNRVMLLRGTITYASSKEFKTLITVTLPITHEQKN